jgi:hypothetical protein
MNNPSLYRFAYTFNELYGTENVKRIRGGHDGGYFVKLEEDAGVTDMGTAIGEAFVKAGYALVGVHEHYSDDGTVDAYSFKEVDEVNETPVPDYFMGDLHYDRNKDTFVKD